MMILWKFDALDEALQRLLDQNIIMMRGDFDDTMFFYVSESIARLVARGAPPITVIITSNGGDIDIGMQIYDLIRMYPGQTTGIVYGWARSAAAIIIQACNKRQMTPASYIQIHPLVSKPLSLAVLTDTAKMEEIIGKLEKLQKRITAIFSNRSGKEEAEIWDLMLREVDLNAQSAFAHGLIDGIADEMPAIPNPYSR